MTEQETACGVPAERVKRDWSAIVLVAAVFVVYAWFYNGGGANQHSRYAMILSFVERPRGAGFSFNISAFARPSATRKYSNTNDWANNPKHDDELYSNKAPGTGLIGIPLYALLRWVELFRGWKPASIQVTYLNFYFLNIFISILPCALSAPFLLRLVRSHFPSAPKLSWIITTGFYFGTLLFPFSTQLWGHPTAVAFLILFLYSWHENRMLTAGVCMGLAVLVEYSCILAALIYLGYLLKSRRREAGSFILGALPFALIYLLYHWICFGNPVLPATFFNNPHHMTHGGVTGVFVLGRAVAAFWGLTFSPYRGLFWYMPVLLTVALTLDQYKRSWREPDMLLQASCVLAMFFMNLFFNGWHGGASTGPRYMIPALPFMLLLISSGMGRFIRRRPALKTITLTIAAVLLAVSACNMWAIASVTPMAKSVDPGTCAQDHEQLVWQNPLPYFYIGLSKGFVQPFRQSLRPFREGEPHFADYRFKSFNLPALYGVTGLLQALPCLALVALTIVGGCRLPSPARRDPSTPT